MPCFCEICIATGKSPAASGGKKTSTAFFWKGGFGAVWLISTMCSWRGASGVSEGSYAGQSKHGEARNLGAGRGSNSEGEELGGLGSAVHLELGEGGGMTLDRLRDLAYATRGTWKFRSSACRWREQKGDVRSREKSCMLPLTLKPAGSLLAPMPTRTSHWPSDDAR